ncbi:MULTISPECIES: hypothetical protein [unclassified Endozoicomonas]|uniref:hypothetical protein n=1 Tax=unclassified Endozoicomonas TaxID=2644528 RepID=UPI003BB50F05
MNQAERVAEAQKLMKQAGYDKSNAPIYHYVSKNLISPKVDGWIDNVSDIHRARYLSIK